MKVCIVCGQEKPLEQFPTNRGMKDGHLGWCFECFAHRHKFYHHPPPKPKEVEPEAKRPKLGRPCTVVGRTPEEQARIERRRQYLREYMQRNRDKYLEAARRSTNKYYWSHREKELTRGREYRKRKKEQQCRQNAKTTSMLRASMLMKSRA